MKIKRILILLLVFFIMISPLKIDAASRWYDLGKGWRVRYDSYDAVKGPHVHFYYGNIHYYCYRLDTGKQCESDYNNRLKDKVPNWVKKSAYEQKEIKAVIAEYHGNAIANALKAIPSWLLISIGALLTVISIITFFLPFDDAVTTAYWIMIFA